MVGVHTNNHIRKADTSVAMHRNTDLSGIAAMLASTASFVVCDSFMKLVTEDLPPFEVLFLRGIGASLFGALLLVVLGQWRGVAGALNPRALLRAAGETLSVLCYIVALARLPIADVIAIMQTAPLILIVAAAILLRERIGMGRLALVIIGFAGAVMVAQPGPAGISPAALLAFASALLLAARDLVGRGVPARISVMVVTFATNVIVMTTAGLVNAGLGTWVAPTGRHLAFLGFAALFVTLGHVGILLAYRLGRTGAVAPFFYSFALWGVLSGLFIWRAWPNALALAGIGLIAGSGVAIIVLDQRRARRGWKTEGRLSLDATVGRH
jgi:drug/metabolite transporter (DMT)-like permease